MLQPPLDYLCTLALMQTLPLQKGKSEEIAVSCIGRHKTLAGLSHEHLDRPLEKLFFAVWNQ
jgi:hypothetical protein